jgi:putative SOS response-associated peptidase YedK
LVIWESLYAPDGEILRTYAIITTPANSEMAAIHERMPLVLEHDQWPAWCGEVPGDPSTMLRPAPAGTLRMWPVSRAVNSVRNNGPQLIEPVGRDADDIGAC